MKKLLAAMVLLGVGLLYVEGPKLIKGFSILRTLGWVSLGFGLAKCVHLGNLTHFVLQR